MKFKVVSFELVSGVENYESGKDFVRIKFEQDYSDIDVIDVPKSKAELCVSVKDKRIPNFVKLINAGELIENPFAEL